MLEERRPQAGAVGVQPGTGAAADAVVPRGPYRDPVTWAIVVAVFGAYLSLSLFRLLQLAPSSWDLLWRAGYLFAMGLAGLALASRRIAKLLLV